VCLRKIRVGKDEESVAILSCAPGDTCHTLGMPQDGKCAVVILVRDDQQ
jgi:hypothetical protein